MAINMCVSIITLNVNGLNATTKRHRVTEQKRKKKPKYIYMLPARDPSKIKRYIHTKSKGM